MRINDAREAVAQLGIEKFIDIHKEKMYGKIENYERMHCANLEGSELETCEITAGKKKGSENKYDMIFIAENLPMIYGVIHVGSKLEDFEKANKWAKKLLPGADALSVLSSLTFIYIVDKGWKEFKDNKDEERRKLWEGIRSRVEPLLE
jgi:hypothetical protein